MVKKTSDVIISRIYRRVWDLIIFILSNLIWENSLNFLTIILVYLVRKYMRVHVL